MPATFTVKQVADILGYSTNSIYTFLKAKRIKGVRVGKGRFRIPQSELDRLLLVKTGSSNTVLPQSSSIVSQKPYLASVDMPTVESRVYAPDVFVDPIASHGRVEVPSLFDWFVGVGSIILGFAMFLFSKSYEEFAATTSISWIPMVRSICIAGGFGLLLSDILGKKSAAWASIFRAILLVVYGLYAVVSVYSGNSDAGVVFGLLVPLLALSFSSAFGGLKLFIAYASATSVYLLGSLVLQSGAVGEAPGLLAGGGIGIVGLLVAWALFLLVERGVFFNSGIVMLCGLLLYASAQYAGHMMWGRALYILMASLCTVFIPIWKTLAFAHKRDRSFVFGVIGSLLLVFIFVIGFIRIMQSNMVSVASRELDNKVVYGKVSVETSLESAKNSLTSLATNPLLIDALQSNKTTTLIDLSKTVVGVNTTIRRVVTISPQGDVYAVYPYSEQTKTSALDTEYYSRARASKQLVISDIFEVVTDESKRKVVVIAVPVLGKESDVVGVIAGFLDIDNIGLKLQQLSSESIGEFAVVVDKSGRHIIHPDMALLGVEVDKNDPIRMGLTGKRGVSDAYRERGMYMLTAVETVNDGTGWAIAMRVPLVSVLRMSETSLFVLLFLLVVSSCIIAIFFFSHRKKVYLSRQDEYVVQKGNSS